MLVVQIDTFDVTSEPVNKSLKWSCEFCVNDGPPLTFKIDTGADVNTISYHHLKTVPNVVMRKSKIRLKPYGTKEFLQPLGVVGLCLRHPYTKEYYKDDFFVIQDNLLGRHFCRRYNLVSLKIPKQLQQIQERSRKNHDLQHSTQHRSTPTTERTDRESSEECPRHRTFRPKLRTFSGGGPHPFNQAGCPCRLLPYVYPSSEHCPLYGYRLQTRGDLYTSAPYNAN